jgi:FkbM family methyltransferase
VKKVLKYIYSLIPFKIQLLTLIRKIFHPGEKIYRHLYFKGVFKVPVKENISFLIRHYGYEIENDIFWEGLTGRWEKKSIEIWMKFSEKAMVVVDIGANTGVYSLISKSLNPDARVIAFEPVERVFKKLEHNMRLNNFATENMLMAVSDHSGEATFYDASGEHSYNATMKKLPQHSHHKPVKVQIITMDDLIGEKKLDRIDLIKIDVEYHEPEVMKGFSLIAKYQPSILIEILSEDIGKRVQQQIENYGGSYLYFDIDEKNGIHKVENIRKSSGMNYLLCTESTAREMQLI